ncbi:MAG: GTP 3',8-cyclase MoaA [Gemmatimonadota bacterium]
MKVSASDPVDLHGRSLGSLRISVIDRCDLRCAYCMPEEDYTWLPAGDILTFGEIEQLVTAFARLGVRRVRLTGGEPLLRSNLVELVERLAGAGVLDDLAMTTNGTQLERLAAPLQRAGLRRVTVSLDSLKPGRFETLTRRAALDRVVAGLRAAAAAGFHQVKVNAVVIRDFNDDELPDLLGLARELGVEIRFIEYMDVGGATLWSLERVVTRQEILRRLQDAFGEVLPEPARGRAPAERFRLADGTRFGVISSTTEPFCSQCDRSRITADGMWYLCLYARDGLNLRDYLRDGAGPDDLVECIRRVWQGRSDRGAEMRLAEPRRGALYQIDELRQDPHREMHTRGG